MAVKTELLDLLVNLPETDTVDKRKAFVSFVGFAFLGIYLDWEGANVVFFPRLVDELSRRGQPTLLQFLQNLPDSNQAEGVERKAAVGKLAAAVKALDESAWKHEFGVAPALPTDRKPDLDMLALSAVSTVLVPYIKAGGGAERPAAAVLAAHIENALAANASASDIWADFKQNPESAERQLVREIKREFPEDAAFAPELEKLTDAAIKEQTTKPGRNEVIQEIRLIQGKVVGAAIGIDVVKLGYVKVTQKVDTVAADGNLTGLTLGNIGG